MIKKIIFSIIFGTMVLSLFLAVCGVESIEFGDSYYKFLSRVVYNLSTINLTIPYIPQIEIFNIEGFWYSVISFLVTVVNSLSTLVNVVIYLLNILTGIISFFFAFFNTIKDYFVPMLL